MSDPAPSLIDLHASQRWNRTTLRTLIDRRRESGFAELPLLSANLPVGVVLRNQGDGRVSPSLDLSGYLLAEPGDLVMNPLGKPHGSLGVSVHRGITSPAYFVARPRPNTRPRFLHYLMRSRLYISEYERVGKYMPPSQFNISWKQLTQIPVYLPALEEQKAIADFLDRETGRIDALVEKKRRLIELLEEKRTGLISHVVTKGLDPTVPMRDSGTPWLGEIPAHWEVVPLKVVAGFREGPGIMAADFRDEGVPLLRIGNLVGDTIALEGCNWLDEQDVHRRWEHFRVQAGELLISASATTSNAAVVPESAEGAVPYTGLIRLWPKSDQLTTDYLRHFLTSTVFKAQVERLKTGVAITHWGPTHLAQVIITFPPHLEQQEIESALTEHDRRADVLLTKLGKQLNLLTEYRQALITAAVTGQIDVGRDPVPISTAVVE